MSQAFPFRRVYGPAIVLAAVTFCGLLSALLGDGIWDAASWCALSIPLAAILWKYGQARELNQENSRFQPQSDSAMTRTMLVFQLLLMPNWR